MKTKCTICDTPISGLEIFGPISYPLCQEDYWLCGQEVEEVVACIEFTRDQYFAIRAIRTAVLENDYVYPEAFKLFPDYIEELDELEELV